MALQRYVIANRRSGKLDANSKMLSRSGVDIALSTIAPREILSDSNPVDPLARRVAVFEADPADVAVAEANMDVDVIVEPEILHWPDVVPPREFLPIRRNLATPLGGGATNAFTLTVKSGDKSLPNAAVNLYVNGPGGIAELRGRTDPSGLCHFQIPAANSPVVAMVMPVGGFWSMLVRGAALSAVVDCPPLPTDGPLGWWHDVMGINGFDVKLGTGIKVGVADTGTGLHPSLDHVKLVGSYVNGSILPPESARDIDSHGTHVAGTIGARPSRPGDYGGIAPGSEVLAARIYRNVEEGASNADIANAIDELSRVHEADLINLSLGATTPSRVVHDAIIEAAECGTLCLCAAGNDAGAVNYPAAFPEAVAVGAIGLQGWGPAGTITASRLPQEPQLFGAQNLFSANFSSHGNEIFCAGPGVGIIAPVPNAYGDAPLHGGLDGTSMACPAVCGALAILLSQNATYRALPRDRTRTEAARQILNEMLQDMKLPLTYEGRGIPVLRPLVS